MPAEQVSFRLVTANVQSFPVDAMTSDQALHDLVEDAAVGDVVLLQEIVERYRPLVAQAFPRTEWEVCFGNRRDNDDPIAFRRALFTRVPGSVQVVQVHPGVAKRHPRRYLTAVSLRHRETDRVLHVTNVHLVSGAFNNKPLADKVERVEEWHAGMAIHQQVVEKLAAAGEPVLGGGDYNRRLGAAEPVGAEVLGRRVRYAVDARSIDVLWLVDGADARWRVQDTTTYPGRGHRDPQRFSDHGARVATVTLTSTKARPTTHPTDAPPGEPTMQKPTVHQPFDKTTFGDVRPKTVDYKTAAALLEAERRLGYRLTIVQGSYNAGGVRQSAGTHDGGGVIDLLPWDWQRKVRVLRSIGFAAWYRPAVTGLWGAHIHAVMVDHGKLSPSAKNQVVAYRNGRDGLKSNLRDPFWHPDPIPVFTYPPPAAQPDAPAAAKVRDRPAQADAPAGPAYPPHPGLDGVDTSHHQSGRPDLVKARAAGLKWWYLKATEGNGYVDPTYAGRARQARRAGIPVGAYHFARPDTGDAVPEAKHFLAHTDIRAGDMLPMLDLESTEGLSPRALTAWTGQWVRTVTRHLAARGLVGRPIIYTPFDLESGFGCYCWVARYSNSSQPPRIPRPWHRAAIWQHSNGVYGPVKQVPGFGHVDVNAVHPDVPLAALRVRRAAPATPTTPVPQPAPTPAPRPVPAPSAPGTTDLAQVRQALEQAARGIQVAIERLPER